MGKTIVEFQDVVKTYGSGEALLNAVNHINFTIEEGEFVVILGQSGAGKSTVLNILGGMDQPTEGKVIVDGKEITGMNDKQLGKYRANTIGFGLSCNLLVDTMYEWTFEKIQKFDNELVLSGDIKIDDADELRDELDGELVMVDQVEISKKKNATAADKTKQTLTVMEGKGYYNITDEKQNILSIPKGTVALSHKVAKELSVDVGDTIYWHIYTENSWYEAKVGVINRSPDTQGITFLREDFEKSGARFTPGILATNQDVSDYKDHKYVTNVVTKAELKQAFDTSMEVVDLLLYIMVGFSVMMIILVLYNSGNLSFNERIKEFATLKVMGLQTAQIRNILTIQNVWLTVIGIIIGAPFGKATLEAMMNSNGEQFDYTLQITPQVYLLSALLVLIVSMLVAFLFQKRIKSLDMVEVLKGVE